MKNIFLLSGLLFTFLYADNMNITKGYKSHIFVNPKKVIINNSSEDLIREVINTYISKSKTNSKNYEVSALEQIGQGNFIQAKNYIEKAIRIAPKRVSLYLTRGMIYYFGGAKKEPTKSYLYQALRDFTYYIENSHGSKTLLSTAYFFRANTYYYLEKDFTLVLEEHRKSCELDKSTCETYNELKELYEEERIEKIRTQKLEKYLNLAKNTYQRDLNKALRYINKAMELSYGSKYSIYFMRGIIYWHWAEKLNNKDYILKSYYDFSYVIGATNNDHEFKSNAYRYLGNMDRYVQDYKGALKNYELACELDKSNCYSFYEFKELLRLKNR